jgi:hypothetical protein
MTDYNKTPKEYSADEAPIILSPNQASESVQRQQKITKTKTKAHYFGEKAILRILAQKGVVGIRVYYGYNDKNEPQAFLVGVDKAGENIFKGELSQKGDKDMAKLDDSGIYTSASPCPSRCPMNNF